MYLEHINGPEDVKKVPRQQLPVLAGEVRQALLHKLSHTGGHVGSNLGVVELAVALHYVFSSPVDKLVWDVSHQCYPHKILTGRREAYTDPARFREVTGYTNPKESEHDLFTIGHTATSVSLALGLARGRDVSGGRENVIAVIGDGALSGGEAYEALNFAGEYDRNLIIILNDNVQSVAENHGGLYRCLAELRSTGGSSPNNLFKALGLEYRYLEDGHDTQQLVSLLESVRDIDHPIVLHIHTVKGKGLPYAEQNREDWHSGSPFRIEDGYPKNGYPVYDTTVHDSLADLLERDEKAVVLTAGTPRALGFVGSDRARWAATGRFVDVGIAEESAVAMSSGLAKYGASAVFGVYAPFLQRSYDQLSHDLCLNANPATILVLMPGAYGMKSNTHLGLCDIPMLRHIPELVYLSPAYREEYLQMLRYAASQKNHPTAIRVPNRFVSMGAEDHTDYSRLNTAKVLRRGRGVAILAVGTLIPKALEMADAARQQLGLEVTVVNPVYLTGLDEALLQQLEADHSLVITLEDGELSGGYGESVAAWYGLRPMKVKTLGISKAFHSDFNADALLAQCGISTEHILQLIREELL